MISRFRLDFFGMLAFLFAEFSLSSNGLFVDLWRPMFLIGILSKFGAIAYLHHSSIQVMHAKIVDV